MARHSEFVEFVLELLAPLGAVRARAMFGGFGIYRGDSFFAIIVDDKLYFKTDHVTRGEFTARGLSPFTYATRGKSINDAILRSPAGSIRGIGSHAVLGPASCWRGNTRQERQEIASTVLKAATDEMTPDKT